MKPVSNQTITASLAKMLKPFVKLHDFLERRDLPESAQQLIMIAPVLAVFTGALALVGVAAFAPAAVVPALLGAAGMATAIGVVGLGANTLIKSVNKREDTTAVNAAGQTISGSAFDIAAVMSIENQINGLTRRLDASTDAGTQAALNSKINLAFAKAAPHIARLQVIEDPAATDATPAYAFAVKREQATVQRIPATNA